MDTDDWFTLEELTARLGGLAWVEAQLAEILTGWGAVESEPTVAIHFASTGGHHRWHRQIVTECLPTSPQLLDPDPVAAPTVGWVNAVNTLRSLDGADATSTRLRSLVKVIDPWLNREVGALLDVARPISEADVIRWLGFVELDLHRDSARSAELLATLASDTVRFGDHVTVSELELT